jgi:hypothetical protein
VKRKYDQSIKTYRTHSPWTERGPVPPVVVDHKASLGNGKFLHVAMRALIGTALRLANAKT